MRSERLKEFSALLSFLSAGSMLAFASLADAPFKHGLFSLIVGVASALAAVSAFTSIALSQRLKRARGSKRVFLIYAREDLDAARRLKEFLRERGFQPWLDVDEVAAGEVWKKSILRGLEESAVALVLVSEHLEKKGYVQAEMRAALSSLQERHNDVSPVIPVRLNKESTVPEALGDIQWVNLFDPDGFERLEDGLNRATA